MERNAQQPALGCIINVHIQDGTRLEHAVSDPPKSPVIFL
jgi:hypothetical protein